MQLDDFFLRKLSKNKNYKKSFQLKEGFQRMLLQVEIVR